MAQDIERPSSNRAEGSEQARQRLQLWTTACETHGWAGERSSAPTVALRHAALPSPLDSRLVLLREPTSSRARSYRLLRHKLLSDADPRIIAVTSPSPGEG